MTDAIDNYFDELIGDEKSSVRATMGTKLQTKGELKARMHELLAKRENKYLGVYSEELMDIIIARVSGGCSLLDITNEENSPNRATIYKWLDAHPEANKRFQVAQRLRAEAKVDEIDEIVDSVAEDHFIDENGVDRVRTEALQRTKLRVEHRKWLASKLSKQYADKNTTEITGAEGTPLIPDAPSDKELARRVAFTLLKEMQNQGANNAIAE